MPSGHRHRREVRLVRDVERDPGARADDHQRRAGRPGRRRASSSRSRRRSPSAGEAPAIPAVVTQLEMVGDLALRSSSGASRRAPGRQAVCRRPRRRWRTTCPAAAARPAAARRPGRSASPDRAGRRVRRDRARPRPARRRGARRCCARPRLARSMPSASTVSSRSADVRVEIPGRVPPGAAVTAEVDRERLVWTAGTPRRAAEAAAEPRQPVEADDRRARRVSPLADVQLHVSTSLPNVLPAPSARAPPAHPPAGTRSRSRAATSRRRSSAASAAKSSGPPSIVPSSECWPK